MAYFTQLQAYLKDNQLGGMIIPHSGTFQTEYLLPHQDYLGWVSGFTGSSGLSIVFQNSQALFVDGRYTLQAAKESPDFDTVSYDKASIIQWLKNQKTSHDLLLCSKDFSYSQIENWKWMIHDTGHQFNITQNNPIDQLWQDRNIRLFKPFYFLSAEHTGASIQEKIDQTLGYLQKNHGFLVADIESVAWLLNIRGGDLDYSPLPFAYVIVWKAGDIDFFCYPEAATTDLQHHLGASTKIHNIYDIERFIQNVSPEKTICFDDSDTPYYIAEKILACGGRFYKNPITLRKAIKNSVERSNIHDSHVEDGIAMCRFFFWIESALESADVTEIEAVEKLLSFRKQSKYFKGNSFPTISASGPNGAIVHYRPTQQSNRTIDKNTFYLLDSGGQYHYGTTDITRTIHFGNPTQLEKCHYTAVLKGHIALASLRFPKGTRGSQIDVLARQYLWQEGLDYQHGTGHGVGYYLNVHEGPCRISKSSGDVDLHEGMLLSNEPGFYLQDAYGIRIESLVFVAQDETFPDFYCFETISLCPLDTNAIDINLLTTEDIQWIDEYHQKVRETLIPYLNDDEKQWLLRKTKSIN